MRARLQVPDEVVVVTRIILPPLWDDDPYLPDLQVVYWVDTTILPPGDPEPKRPVVVVAVPENTNGTVRVVTRSTTEQYGVEHTATRELGLNKAGRFSRLLPVQGALWTMRNVSWAGQLDDVTFAAVCARFQL
jgi:hypothetical protein